MSIVRAGILRENPEAEAVRENAGTLFADKK